MSVPGDARDAAGPVFVPLGRPAQGDAPGVAGLDGSGVAGLDGSAGGGAHPVVHDVRAEDLDALAGAATALSRWLLAPPSTQPLAVVRTPDMLARWPLPERGPTAAGLAALAVSGRSAAAGEGEDAAQIAADHARLFVGPGRPPAAPYESVHRSSEGLLFDEQTLAVRAWYRHYGLAAPRQGREPDDHVGLELEFVATLLGGALDSLDEGEEQTAGLFATAAAGFVEQHLAAWAPGFFELVADRADTEFYRGVARLGAGWLQEAAAVLPAVS